MVPLGRSAAVRPPRRGTLAGSDVCRIIEGSQRSCQPTTGDRRAPSECARAIASSCRYESARHWHLLTGRTLCTLAAAGQQTPLSDVGEAVDGKWEASRAVIQRGLRWRGAVERVWT